MIEYILTRSKRKTVALYIRNDGLEVRAPLQVPKCDIDKIVAKKEPWILDKLVKSREQNQCRAAFCLNYGASVIYRGQPYPIVAQEGRRLGFDGGRFFLPPALTPQQIKAACVQIYRMLAKRDLICKAQDYAGRMGLMPQAVRISGAKTRWGSCSANKNINFSWRLIMADDAVIDYVVVHELAHLKEMNHSPRFWQIVEGLLPEYKKQQARLKELQNRLGGEDWEQ
jgi:predicted metal-dependent hydrolase